MPANKHTSHISALLVVVLSEFASADVKAEIGYNELLLWNGGILVTTDTVKVGLVEASVDGESPVFAPTIGSSETSGKTLTVVGETSSSGVSWHANNVSANYFGNLSSVAPEVNEVDIWYSSDFINDFLRDSIVDVAGVPVGLSVGQTDVKVINHSYISEPPDPLDSVDYVVRFDFLTQDSGVLNVTGLNNGSSSVVPPIWGDCYNGISVGLTSGAHSSGDTTVSELVAGRQKPEIVAPETLVSWGAPVVASAGSLLIAKAKNMDSGNGELPMVVKSILMAGATKDEVSWSNTPERPLDEHFGAGEVNVLHSYRIMDAGEQLPGIVGLRGWAKQTVSSGALQSYTIDIDSDYAEAVCLSVNLSWEREVTATVSGAVTEEIHGYAYEDLADLTLKLMRVKSGQDDVEVATSECLTGNVEHIWFSDLEPGEYRLDVSSSSLVNTDYCLAWRAEVSAKNTVANDDFQLDYSEMIPSHSYILQSSSDLENWLEVTGFISSGSGTFSYTDPTPNMQRFFRLKYYTP